MEYWAVNKKNDLVCSILYLGFVLRHKDREMIVMKKVSTTDPQNHEAGHTMPYRATWRTMASQEAEREDRARPRTFAGVLWQGMDEAGRYTK